MTVALMGWMWRLRVWCNGHQTPGSFGLAPWALRPERLQWLNNPSGKHRHRAIWGSASAKPEAKIDHKSVGAIISPPKPDHTTGILRVFASTQPFAFFPPARKRHNRFHPRRSRGRSFAENRGLVANRTGLFDALLKSQTNINQYNALQQPSIS